MGTSARFWDRLAERYAKKPIADPKAYQEKLELTRDYLSPDSSVLEFGCGTGSTALTHADHVRSILAIDSSQKMIEIANRKKKKSNVTNIEFRQATLFELAETLGSFDVIMGLNVLHLVDDLEGSIKRSYELLKPGGVFVTSTPCIGENAKFLKFILPIGGKLGLIPAVAVFDIATFEATLNRVGYAIVKNVSPGKDRSSCFVIARK